MNALCSAAAIIPRQAGLIVHHELSGTNLASARNVEEFALRQRASVHSRYNGGESPNDLQKRGVTDTVSSILITELAIILTVETNDLAYPSFLLNFLVI